MLSFESVGGSSLEAWPADPPLQQVVLEPLGEPERMAAFGVGMSGHGHWSLAAESPPNRQDSIQFDWACRIHQPAERLGSTYRTSAPDTISDASLGWRLLDGHTLTLETVRGQIRWNPHDQTVSIEPTSDCKANGTHCWCYSFRFE
ncbi:MAG: hypothetical protein MUF23_07970 [Pirellula sp.]|jgi:hypothetical protein|nr:hypothetical protein [Pirellula sp.]